jgi:hypothetical protein
MDCRMPAKRTQFCAIPALPECEAISRLPSTAANRLGYDMPRKPKPDNPEQFRRFIETAREVGADADPETFGRVLEEVARSSRPKPTPKTRRPRKPKDRA